MRLIPTSMTLGLCLALPLLSVNTTAKGSQLPIPPGGECTDFEKSQDFRSYGQVSSDGVDRSAFGKILELEMIKLPDSRFSELSVRGNPKGMASLILVGARESEVLLPWGDTLLVADVVGLFVLPGDSSSMLIDLDAIERPVEGSLEIYLQAFSFDPELPYPLTSSNGLEISLSYREVLDYHGPKISTSLLSTDSIPPVWSLIVCADVWSWTHELRLDSISRSAEVTRVFMSLHDRRGVGDEEVFFPLVVVDPAKAHVELGTDVAERIEIWIRQGNHADGTPCHALAHTRRREL